MNYFRPVALLWLLPAFSVLLGGQSETERHQSEVLATIGDVEISEAEVRVRAAQRLQELKLEALRFEAEQREKQYQAVREQLEEMVSDEVLKREAGERGLETEALLQAEVFDKLTPPTDEMVDNFFEANKERIRSPKEQIVPQIRRFLEQQQREDAHQSYIGELKKKFGVEYHLDPLRIQVETEGHPAQGPETAPITIVEFSDFECPYCTHLFQTMEKVQENYEGQIRLVFRQFPLTGIHPHAQKAAEASLCAHEQDQFWPMHDALFADRSTLKIDDLKAKAAQLGLNMETFNQCLDSGRYAADVEADLHAGAAAGVTGTPALFINGRRLVGAAPYEQVIQIIDEELKSKQKVN